MLGVGALVLAAWERAASQAESTAGGNKVTYVRRHHDATPMYLGFGSLHQQLQPQARYLRPLEADRPGGWVRWVTCTFEEFKKWQPRSRPQSGIFEVFGQDAEVTTAIGDGDHPDVKTQRRIYPPKILARGNASCIHSAVGGASTSSLHFPVQKIKEMGTAGIVFLDEIPDACKANKRHKSFVVDALKDTDGALINEHATCAVHGLHNIVTKTIGEGEFVGHLHAVQTVGSINQRRNQLMGAARHVLSSTLHCTAGVAPPKFDEQSTFILENFLYRKTEHIRSEAASEGILSSRRGSVARASEHGFRTYINGDKTLDTPWHWCNGCCIDPSTGVTTRTQQVENFLAALVCVCGIIWRQPLGSSTEQGEVVVIEYFMCRGVRSLGTRSFAEGLGGRFSKLAR